MKYRVKLSPPATTDSAAAAANHFTLPLPHRLTKHGDRHEVRIDRGEAQALQGQPVRRRQVQRRRLELTGPRAVEREAVELPHLHDFHLQLLPEVLLQPGRLNVEPSTISRVRFASRCSDW